MTLNHLEPPKRKVLVNFFPIIGCSAHFTTELRPNSKR